MNESHESNEPPSAKRKRVSGINLKFCLLCQTQTKEPLVENAKSAEKLVDSLRIRRECCDTSYAEITEYLGEKSGEDLMKCNVKWHLSCYKRCTHKGMLERLQAKCKKSLENKTHEYDADGDASMSTSEPPCTRSKLHSKLQSTACFFCDRPKSRHHPLHTVSTQTVGKRLFDVVQKSENAKWKLKLSECIDPEDSHAYDVAYHKQCFSKNVDNTLRNSETFPECVSRISECASQVEFIDCLLDALLDGKVVTMADAERCYQQICCSKGVKDEDMISRKSLKSLIENELFSLDLIFTNPVSRNQPQRIMLRSVSEALISHGEESCNLNSNLKIIYQAAKLLRKEVMAKDKWTYSGSLTQDEISRTIPQELSSFIKWFICGKSKFDNVDINNDHLKQKIDMLSQTLMYECRTERQATLLSQKPRHTRELPLQVGVGLTIHSKTRSKFMVQLMHGLGISIDYNRILRLETSIANEVLRRTEINQGLYVPPGLVKQRFMYCAADNLDFLEDTPDGKGTLHATVMTCYQESHGEYLTAPITLEETSIQQTRSLKILPHQMTNLMSYIGPKLLKPKSKLFLEKDVNMNINEPETSENINLAWTLCKVSYIQDANHKSLPDEGQSSECVPNWNTFNAMLQDTPASMTNVYVLPIIPLSPTDRSVQLTFLTYLESLTKHISGNEAKCIITLDLGLYRPVQQLIMAKQSLHNRFILRAGELHIVMAFLRAIGTYCDGCGIPELWEVWFSESVVQQIITGKHVRRAVDAHKRTLIALYKCYMEEFSKSQICQDTFSNLMGQGNKCNTKEEIKDLISFIKGIKLSEKMEEFDRTRKEMNPTFKMLRNYMVMVECLLDLVRSIRSGDWNAHISSIEAVVPYFFALDMHNYSGMMAYYLAEMKSLKKSDPTIWKEFEKGNWVVRQSMTPFCALGTDEALEHQNRAMKVTGGLVGITQHPAALARYFLTAPVLDEISKQISNMAGVSEKHETVQRPHYESKKALERENDAIMKLSTELQRIGNPFSHDGPELLNIATKAVFCNDIEKDVGRVHDLGSHLYDKFKTERLIMESTTANLWDPIKKNKLNLCASAKKKLKVKVNGTVKELRADRSLFARLLIISRSQRHVDLRDLLGTYEFSAVPRSLFHDDGTLHQCQQKSKLIEILKSNAEESLSVRVDTMDKSREQSDHMDEPTSSVLGRQFSVAMIDAMAELQALQKSKDMETCKDLADAFVSKIQDKYWKYDEIHLVFDSYVENSIKSITRHKRLHGATPSQFKIMDSTIITNVTMKKLLSHTETKDELSFYLSQRVYHYAKERYKNFVASWRTEVVSTHCNLECLRSTQEEADTKMILHAMNAKERGALKLFFFCQDTDVLVLAIRRCESLPEQTFFMPNSKTAISIKEMFSALGPAKALALPAFHSLSGCDTTGTLAGKGKLSYWKAFTTATEETLHAIATLGVNENISDHVLDKLEAFICQVYKPGINVTKLADLRWYLFSKKQVAWEKLPPTKSALIPALKRVNYQAIVWNRDGEAQPTLPSPIGNGWDLIDGQISPSVCDLPCAPNHIMNLIRCNCVKSRCSAPCKCLGNNLPCTEMCECGGSDEFCSNDTNMFVDLINSDSEDELADD